VFLAVAIRVVLLVAVITTIVAFARRHIDAHQQNSSHVKAHSRAEKEAERKLKEMERNM
jgi:hypothetical protein